MEVSKETKFKAYKKKDAIFYDRKAFKYDNIIPLPSIGFNPDDRNPNRYPPHRISVIRIDLIIQRELPLQLIGDAAGD